MIIFYQKSTGKIFSYISYNNRDEEENLIRPSLKQCSEIHGINESDIEVVEWTKASPSEEDFKDNVEDLNEEDLEDIN
jgi:hypothetical protein